MLKLVRGGLDASIVASGATADQEHAVVALRNAAAAVGRLVGDTTDAGRRVLVQSRPGRGSWTVLEHVAHVRAQLDETWADVSRLRSGRRPPAWPLRIDAPGASSNDLDPEDELWALVDVVERLADAVGAMTGAEWLVVGPVVADAVRDAEDHVEAAGRLLVRARSWLSHPSQLGHC